MEHQAQVFRVDDEVKRRLVQKLGRQSEIIRFEDDPALASLCTCLGLQFELGNKDFDRLSPFFGVEVPKGAENPWASEIFTAAFGFGIRFWRIDGKPLAPRHQDLCHILHPSSIDRNGELSQAVLLPCDIARTFRQKGFELVIVRDWLLSSSLNLDHNNRVTYLIANRWEIEQNIAMTQVKMMTARRLAFFGTHDIADHLIQADAQKFDQLQDLYQDVATVFATVFTNREVSTRSQLLLSYLIGVLLDDLAQSKWYGSKCHEMTIRLAIYDLMRAQHDRIEQENLTLPPSFHLLVAAVRDESSDLEAIDDCYAAFAHDVCGEDRCGQQPALQLPS